MNMRIKFFTCVALALAATLAHAQRSGADDLPEGAVLVAENVKFPEGPLVARDGRASSGAFAGDWAGEQAAARAKLSPMKIAPYILRNLSS